MSEPGVSASRLMGAAELGREAERWRARGERLAVAAGAFDLLDVRQARALAALRSGMERLVVAVSDDVTARSRLGAGRPVQPAAERGRLVAALRGVDAVVVTDVAGLNALIATLNPERIGAEGETGVAGERIARLRATPRA